MDEKSLEGKFEQFEMYIKSEHDRHFDLACEKLKARPNQNFDYAVALSDIINFGESGAYRQLRHILSNGIFEQVVKQGTFSQAIHRLYGAMESWKKDPSEKPEYQKGLQQILDKYVELFPCLDVNQRTYAP